MLPFVRQTMTNNREKDEQTEKKKRRKICHTKFKMKGKSWIRWQRQLSTISFRFLMLSSAVYLPPNRCSPSMVLHCFGISICGKRVNLPLSDFEPLLISFDNFFPIVFVTAVCADWLLRHSLQPFSFASICPISPSLFLCHSLTHRMHLHHLNSFSALVR